MPASISTKTTSTCKNNFVLPAGGHLYRPCSERQTTLGINHIHPCHPLLHHSRLISMGETDEDDIVERTPPQEPPSKNDGLLQYICYGTSKESPYLPAIKQLISKDLSEPYSIYVYRYFLYQWGDLCFMVNQCLSYTTPLPRKPLLPTNTCGCLHC